MLTIAEPFHRAWRGYLSRDGVAYVLRPDGYGIFARQGGGTSPFFLEWERRAERPGRYLGKVHPYIRYYQHGELLEDVGEWPVVLFVLRDEVAEAGFLKTALPEVGRGYLARDRLRLLTTTEAFVEAHGPARPIWRERSGGPRSTPWPVGR